MATVKVKFSGDTSEFTRAVNKIRGDVSGLASSMKIAGGIVAGVFSVRALAGAVTSAAAAAKSLLATGLELAKIGEASNIADARIVQITTSMGLFGSETQAVAKHVQDLSTKLSLQTAVDDNIIKLAAAKLLTFKSLAETSDEMGGAFDRALQAALDLAAAGFGSAETNATQLGKALQDPVKGIAALARGGVTFTESEKDKIAALMKSNNLLAAQDVVLKAIERQVGGTAAATATASAKLENMVDEAKEAFGTGLAEAMVTLQTQVQNLNLDALEDKLQQWGEKVGAVVSQVLTEAFAGQTSTLAAIGGAIWATIMAGMESAIKTSASKIGSAGISAIFDNPATLPGFIGQMFRKPGEQTLGQKVAGLQPTFAENLSNALGKRSGALEVAAAAVAQAEQNRAAAQRAAEEQHAAAEAQKKAAEIMRSVLERQAGFGAVSDPRELLRQILTEIRVANNKPLVTTR